MRILLTIIILQIITNQIQAQFTHIKRLGIEDGLSNNYIIDITEDKQGFIWIATESGLNRFDGKTFRTYKKEYDSTQGISSNNLNCLYVSPVEDKLWIATQRSGLSTFNFSTDSFNNYENRGNDTLSLKANDITRISPQQNSNSLWISTYSQGIDLFEYATKQFIHFNKNTIPSLKSNQVWVTKEDQQHHLYIGHVYAGLSILNLNTRTAKNYTHNPLNPHSIPGNDIQALCIDNCNRIWIGTEKGLALFNPEQESFTTFHDSDPSGALSDRIFCITQTADNKLWIGTENKGVCIFDINTLTFTQPQQLNLVNITNREDERGLSSPSIRSIYEDAFHNIWIGTYGGGINFIGKIAPSFDTWKFSQIKNNTESINNKVAWGICSDKHNCIWIGTDGGGINVFKNGKRIKIYTKNAGELTDNAILSAFKDSQNNLWFGSFSGGVNYYDSNQNKFIKNNSIPVGRTEDVRCFFEDKNQNIWIGSNNGLYSYNLNTHQSQHFTSQNSSLQGNFVRSITQDSQGNLWVGTYIQGIAIFNKNFKCIKKINTKNGLYSNTINHLFLDSHNNTWAASREGLIQFDDSMDFKIYLEKDGISNNSVKAITEDSAHNLWISTDGGICTYNYSTQTFKKYDHSDGVPLGSFSAGSVAKDTQNKIYFGSQNGMCFFHPEQINTHKELTPPRISDLSVFETKVGISDLPKRIQIQKNIELNYDQNTFKISFNQLNYAIASSVEYAYRLQGLDDTWFNTHGENSVIFRNLPSGNYTFQVKSRIHNGNWDEQITSQHILIKRPYWFTWYAQTIYFLILLAFVVFFLRLYKRKLKLENALLFEKKELEHEHNLNNERLHFFTNVTHELRTPLTLILGPLEDMIADAKLLPIFHSKIATVHKSANKLLALVNQILDFRKVETSNKKLCVSKGNLTQLVQEIGNHYQNLTSNTDVIIKITTEDQHPFLYDSEIVSTIIDNLISNAVKYTHKGEVSIQLKTTTVNAIPHSEISISDTGIGISDEALPYIFNRYYQEKHTLQTSGTGIGLSLVQSLTKIHEGTISVKSKLHEGSTFTFTLNQENTYPNAIHWNKDTDQHPFNDLDDESKPLILVVEDNLDVQKYIQEALSAHYRIITASNGNQALSKSFAQTPDIIIMDIMMPEKDGIEACKILKEDIRTSHIPVILLTAKDTIEDKTLGYSAGADSYITKPFSARLLVSRLANLIESQQRISKIITSNTTLNKQQILSNSISKLDHEFLERVTSIIKDNLESAKIDVVHIASQINMSHSTFYRKIKALTGLTANLYIRKIKMQSAEEMLLSGKYTISEVSYWIGMSSISYFRQCFKEEYGISPSEYIKQLKDTPTKQEE